MKEKIGRAPFLVRHLKHLSDVPPDAAHEMKSFAAVESSERLSESQRIALISLLGDDDAAVYEAVRSKLVSFGPQVTDWLQPYTLSDEPLIRRRTQQIINYFGRQAADERFMLFCGSRGEDLPLEEGAWLLARTQHPD